MSDGDRQEGKRIEFPLAAEYRAGHDPARLAEVEQAFGDLAALEARYRTVRGLRAALAAEGLELGEPRLVPAMTDGELGEPGDEDFPDWSEPPPPPAGPAAYCGACARSGVGACDDFPDCPGGRS
jgi:hypothetical protein